MNNQNLNIIIPAAGLGTRMRPLSSGLSKTLISLNGRPILAWILESIKSLPYTIDNIVIVTNESGDIKEFVDNTYKCTPLYSKIKCVVQDYLYNGPGGAILTGIEATTNTDAGYLIWLGDTVCRYPFKTFGSNVCLATSKVDIMTAHRWCVPYISNNTHKFLNKLSQEQIRAYYKNEEYIDALIGIYYFPSYNYALSKSNEQYKHRFSEIDISELIDSYVSYEKNIAINLIDVQSEWYDCGELDSFYSSKGRLLNLACREQSGLKADTKLNTVKKYSYIVSGAKKLQKEYQWYKSRSKYQKLFIPKIIDHDGNSYTMELSSGTPLSDMFIYEKVPMSGWKSILKRVIDIYHEYFAFNTEFDKSKENLLEKCKHYHALAEEFYFQRTFKRLTDNLDFYKSLNTSFDVIKCKKYLESFVSDICVSYQFNTEMFLATKKEKYYPRNMIDTFAEKNNKNHSNIHGDFHLGNILFDPMSGKYTFLDPRGGEMYAHKAANSHEHDKTYVDSYYDMSKLYHDLYCGYMLMVHEICSVNNGTVTFSNYHQNMMKEAIKYLDMYLKSKYTYDVELIKRLSVIQILTCIPFHKDNANRCKLFLTRALNLMNIE